MAKKLKFGIYSVEASVIHTDDVDLDEHFTRAEWDAMSATEQVNWIQAHIEEQALSDLSINYKLTT
jgi:hypothetical protein